MSRAGRLAAVIALAHIACGGADDAAPRAAAPDAGATADSGAADSSTAPLDAASGEDAGTDAASSNKFDADGPGTYATSTASVTNGASTFNVSLYVPAAAGAHPVVSISPGLQQPAAAYESYAKRFASYGIVVVARDDPGAFTGSAIVASDLAYLVGTWLPAKNMDSASPLSGKIDASHVGLMGHSRGGQASLLAAEGALKGKVHAWWGLDPVDSNLTGQARTTLGSIGIPTGFLGASVTTSCSPAADNYQVLYGAAPSPSVLVTGVGANHTQIEDQAGCVLCNLCTPAGTADTSTVLAYSVRYATAFFARELLGDASVGATFQGAGGPSDVAAGRVTIASK